MPLILWSDKYSVRINSIDTQHKKLIEIINKLHDSMSKGTSKDILNPILQELIKYTIEHFAFEEALLKSHNYISLPTHKMEHDRFTKKVQGFQTDFEAGRASISIDIITFLKDWLLNHILKTDMNYSEFLTKKV